MNFNDIKEIKAKRLLLRPINDSDAERMTVMFSSEEIAKTYMMPDFKSNEEKKRLFLRFKELSVSSDRFVRGICLDGIMIGFMNDVDIGDGHIELGYVVDPGN